MWLHLFYFYYLYSIILILHFYIIHNICVFVYLRPIIWYTVHTKKWCIPNMNYGHPTLMCIPTANWDPWFVLSFLSSLSHYGGQFPVCCLWFPVWFQIEFPVFKELCLTFSCRISRDFLVLVNILFRLRNKYISVRRDVKVRKSWW